MSDIPTYQLARLTDDGHATYGQIVDSEQRLVCRTLELPWKDNVHDESCCPPGIYAAHRRLGTENRHGYDVFELEGVPGRSNIQIHIGNFAHDSLGCILVGNAFDIANGQRIVTQSRDTYFNVWMKQNRGRDHLQLVIVGPDHQPIAA